MLETLYLAGPMQGIREFNFPAFDRATAALRKLGYRVISPAEQDRERGFDPAGMDGTTLPESFNMAEVLMYDLHMIATLAGGIALLPHHENSKGVAVELAMARALNIPVKPVGLWKIAAELKEVQLVGSP